MMMMKSAETRKKVEFFCLEFFLLMLTVVVFDSVIQFVFPIQDKQKIEIEIFPKKASISEILNK